MRVYSWVCTNGCPHKLTELTTAQLNTLRPRVESIPVAGANMTHQSIREQIDLILFARQEGIPL